MPRQFLLPAPVLSVQVAPPSVEVEMDQLLPVPRNAASFSPSAEEVTSRNPPAPVFSVQVEPPSAEVYRYPPRSQAASLVPSEDEAMPHHTVRAMLPGTSLSIHTIGASGSPSGGSATLQETIDAISSIIVANTNCQPNFEIPFICLPSYPIDFRSTGSKTTVESGSKREHRWYEPPRWSNRSKLHAKWGLVLNPITSSGHIGKIFGCQLFPCRSACCMQSDGGGETTAAPSLQLKLPLPPAPAVPLKKATDIAILQPTSASYLARRLPWGLPSVDRKRG